MNKKIILAAIFSLALIFTACGDDTPTNSTNTGRPVVVNCVAEEGVFEILSPVYNNLVNVGDTITVQWMADIDDGFRSFDVELSADNGRTFVTMDEESIQIDNNIGPAPQCFEYELIIPAVLENTYTGDILDVTDALILKVRDYDDATLKQTVDLVVE